MALAEAGVELVVNGRDEKVLNSTAEEIRDLYKVKVTAVATDVSDAGWPSGPFWPPARIPTSS